MSCLSNKKILVTGACGTVGSKLIESLLIEDKYQPSKVIGIDNNESQLFFLDQSYQDESRACFFMGDIRDSHLLNQMMQDVDIVFHAAALKHVIICERSPSEAVQTNIIGGQNIISAAQQNQVEKVIFTSSDKAVNPSNVMGTSKLMGERLMTAANGDMNKSNTIFVSTRFGNVLGSNGSVIPIFDKQIQTGGPITLTDPEMTRFVMTVDEAVRLIINSAEEAHGGEVFVTKMPVLKIKDLASAMINLLAPVYGFKVEDIKIKIIGSKPGEKLYEELMTDEETHRAIELDQYYSILPCYRGLFKEADYKYSNIINELVEAPYVSSEASQMTIDEISNYLIKNLLIEGYNNRIAKVSGITTTRKKDHAYNDTRRRWVPRVANGDALL